MKKGKVLIGAMGLFLAAGCNPEPRYKPWLNGEINQEPWQRKGKRKARRAK